MRKELNKYVTQQEYKNVKEFKGSVSKDLELMYMRITDIHEEIIFKLGKMVERASVDVKRNILTAMGGRPVDIKEMKEFLNLKVDKVEFNQLHCNKVDKEEFQFLNSSFEEMISLLKTLTIVI